MRTVTEVLNDIEDLENARLNFDPENDRCVNHKDMIAPLKNELDALRASFGVWNRDISQAPKDGRDILMYSENAAHVGYYNVASGAWVSEQFWYSDISIEAWMPIPELL